MPFCAVAPDCNLNYQDFGSGPSMLFVPAGNLTHAMWDGQVAAMAATHRTIAPDWRGTGGSDRPRGGYDGHTAMTDFATLLDRLHAGPAVVVAHGIGTHLALLLAEARPDLVRGLVLVSTAPWFTGERDGVAGGVSAAFLDFIINQGSVPYADTCWQMGERWMFHVPPGPGTGHALMQQALSWPQYVLNSYATAMRGIDHRERLHRIACPVLLVQGRHDHKQRYEGVAYMAERLPQARLLTMEHSAHMPQIEELALFNRELAAFTAGLEALSSAA